MAPGPTRYHRGRARRPAPGRAAPVVTGGPGDFAWRSPPARRHTGCGEAFVVPPPARFFVLLPALAVGAGCLAADPGLEATEGLLGENAALTDEAPVLRPVSRDLATALGRRLRTLRVGDGTATEPVAWA